MLSKAPPVKKRHKKKRSVENELKLIQETFTGFDLSAWQEETRLRLESRPSQRVNTQNLQLSPDQKTALEIVVKSLSDPAGPRVTRLAGASGCGKTSISAVLLDQYIEHATLAAPTWRAAMRLRNVTGRVASSIHSITFAGVDEEASEAADSLEFVRRGNENEAIENILILDEASMVGSDLWSELEAVLPPGTKVLAIGDHCQLAPIKGDPAFDLDRAEAKLDKVHRQAAGSDILRYATWIRSERRKIDPAVDKGCYATTDDVFKQNNNTRGLRFPGRVSTDVIGRTLANCRKGKDPTGPEAAIVYTHAIRGQICDATRQEMGYPPLMDGPQVGEPVQVTSTLKGIVCNGEIGTVLAVAPGRVIPGLPQFWHVLVDIGDPEKPAYMVAPASSWSRYPLKEARVAHAELHKALSQLQAHFRFMDDVRLLRERACTMTSAFAVTCHSMQGNEMPRGFVVLEDNDWIRAKRDWRWDYTALTRFKEKVGLLTV